MSRTTIVNCEKGFSIRKPRPRARAAKLGLRLAKVGLVWPLSAETVRKAAEGLDVLIVVEEKRALIEPQIREALYGLKAAPVVIGKKDEDGRDLFMLTAASSQRGLASTQRSGRIETARAGSPGAP